MCKTLTVIPPPPHPPLQYEINILELVKKRRAVSLKDISCLFSFNSLIVCPVVKNLTLTVKQTEVITKQQETT